MGALQVIACSNGPEQHLSPPSLDLRTHICVYAPCIYLMHTLECIYTMSTHTPINMYTHIYTLCIPHTYTCTNVYTHHTHIHTMYTPHVHTTHVYTHAYACHVHTRVYAPCTQPTRVCTHHAHIPHVYAHCVHTTHPCYTQVYTSYIHPHMDLHVMYTTHMQTHTHMHTQSIHCDYNSSRMGTSDPA